MVNFSDIRNAKILIIDDLEANVRLLEQMLRNVGYTCSTSTMDPHAVCTLHRDNDYDLILLDLLMPDMDEFLVMEGLQAIETDSYVPVNYVYSVFLTSPPLQNFEPSIFSITLPDL